MVIYYNSVAHKNVEKSCDSITPQGKVEFLSYINTVTLFRRYNIVYL